MACARRKLRYPAAKPLPPAAERRADEGVVLRFSPQAVEESGRLGVSEPPEPRQLERGPPQVQSSDRAQEVELDPIDPADGEARIACL